MMMFPERGPMKAGRSEASGCGKWCKLRNHLS